MRKLAASIAMASAGLTGCATGDYKVYADTQRAIAEAQTSAAVAKIEALSEIAKSGDTTARVAAVISLNQLQQQNNVTTLRQPDSTGDTLLKWTSVLLPSLTQLYGIGKNADIAITNSNNNKDVAINNNQSMVNMGRLIADQPAPVIGGSDVRLIYPEPTN